MTISDIDFDSPEADGALVGSIYFNNGYSICLIKYIDIPTYDCLTFCIQNKDSKNLWIASMDANLLTVSPTNDLVGQTEEQVNNYITQVENLSNS